MQFVCAVCMQAMTHSVDNVPSQQAVELVVVRLDSKDAERSIIGNIYLEF